MTDWQDKKVAVVGFGREGQAMLPYLLREGAEVTVCDEREATALGAAYATWQGRNVRWQLGPAYLNNLSSFSIIVRSPGVPLTLTALTAVRDAGIELTSPTKIFFSLSPAPIIGVTGTKGKGTTSTLILKMLEASGKTAHLVGNIGEPSIATLEKIKAHDWVIYELSSFQLQDLNKSPHIAVVLGLTVDHQDYHQSPDEYFTAKANIVKFQKPNDAAVFTIDYPETRRLEASARGSVYYTSREVPVNAGAYVAGDVIFRRLNDRTEHVVYRHEVALKGEHNLENVTAAIVVASLAGASLPAIRTALQTFSGLPHRLEFIGEVHEVQYWNNSYGTTPETTVAAIRSFKEPIVLMLGGSEKGLSYDRLATAIIESSVKAIIGIGLSAETIYAAAKKVAEARGLSAPPLIPGGETMAAMVKTARKFAKSGDVVLLSPAAASFDKFKNATDRGEQFRAAVIKKVR